jgi:hypothetical protein
VTPVPRFRARRPSAALVVALVALFVALGGPAEAQRLLSGSHITPDTITSKQIKDRSVEARDLSGKARRRLTATPAGSITDAQIGQAAVTSRAVADATLVADDIATGAVGTEEVGDNAVGQAEIRPNAVGASEIADQSVDGGEIIDGGLMARDIARFSGTLEARFPSVPARDCVAAIVTNSAADVADADISRDLLLVSAGDGWPSDLTYHVKNAAAPDADKFFLFACNPTAAAVAPPAVVLFGYAIIGL